jgi:HK97 gp10 family phage protein
MAKLVSNLGRIAVQAPQAAKAALLQTAADIVDLTKQLSPVDTGALKQSYGAVPVDSGTVQIGSDKLYAPYVEYGTSHQAAQPHLTPAFLQSEETFKARLSEAIERLAK